MRRIGWMGIIIAIALLGILEYYTFFALRFAVREVRSPFKHYILGGYIFLTLVWFAIMFYFPTLRTAEISKTLRNFLIAFGMGFFFMKLLITLILFLDDVKRVLFWIASKFSTAEIMPSLLAQGMSRSEFLNKTALLLGGTLMGGLVYGMSNRYKYRVKKIAIGLPNLPLAFKGMRIVQISDIHSGSLNNILAVERGVQMILNQKPDLILFTGDLVNNKSSEAENFKSVFSKLEAPLGVFSVLGNHDYGDYAEWKSEIDKKANLDRLKRIHAEMGWKLLLDENVLLEREGQQIALLGVQNISFKNNFQTYGNLEKAYQNTSNIPFKILMSHDPSHWDGEINTKYKDIDLTLSGHTHGFQFGVELPWFKWSPSQFVYKQWAGLYEQDKQYLYVNRGFGFLGYPGRLGILPEITCIELS